MKVFIVNKVAGCRPLALLKLTLSGICFKELCKNYFFLCFRKWLIIVQILTGVLPPYHSGVDKEGNVYKGIVRFMAVRLKQSKSYVVQAIPQASQANPEVTFNGQWLAEKISNNIDSLIQIGLSIRGIVTDNHSANVNAFSALRNIQFRIKLLYKASAKQ